MPGEFAERTRERFRAGIAAIDRNVDDGLAVAKRESVACAFNAAQAHVFNYAQLEQRRKLPMEMEWRKANHLRQDRNAQRLLQLRLDMRQHVAKTFEVGIAGVGHGGLRATTDYGDVRDLA